MNLQIFNLALYIGQLILLTLLIKCISSHSSHRLRETLSLYPVVMPLIMPSKNEVYLCTAVDVSEFKMSFWIRGFEPHVDNSTVHHIALAGCNHKPAFRETGNVWNCGQNTNLPTDDSYPTGPVCGHDVPSSASPHQQSIDTTLFLWSINGSSLMLPDDVGFKFGAESSIGYFVLQVC